MERKEIERVSPVPGANDPSTEWIVCHCGFPIDVTGVSDNQKVVCTCAREYIIDRKASDKVNSV